MGHLRGEERMTTITLPPLLIGLYSAKAADLFGTIVYVDINGEEKHVTCVTTEEDWIPNYKWKDTIRVGYMTRYLRKGRLGRMEEWKNYSRYAIQDEPKYEFLSNMFRYTK